MLLGTTDICVKLIEISSIKVVQNRKKWTKWGNEHTGLNSHMFSYCRAYIEAAYIGDKAKITNILYFNCAKSENNSLSGVMDLNGWIDMSSRIPKQVSLQSDVTQGRRYTGEAVPLRNMWAPRSCLENHHIPTTFRSAYINLKLDSTLQNSFQKLKQSIFSINAHWQIKNRRFSTFL